MGDEAAALPLMVEMLAKMRALLRAGCLGGSPQETMFRPLHKLVAGLKRVVSRCCILCLAALAL